MVTKCKESEAKIVVILAERIVKPLIAELLSEENPGNGAEGKQDEHKKQVREIKFLKCFYCDKTSNSSPGLKSHVTKMHKEVKINEKTTIGATKEDKCKNTMKRKSKDEVKDIVDNLLSEVIEIIDDDGSSEAFVEATLEEVCDKDTGTQIYTDKCENCDYIAEACRKYLAIQLVLKVALQKI